MMHTKNQFVEIKGQKDGLWIYLTDQGTLDELLLALDERLQASNGFFSGAEVMIDTGTRPIAPDDEVRLREIVERRHTLHIKKICFTDAPQALSAESSESFLDDAEVMSSTGDEKVSQKSFEDESVMTQKESGGDVDDNLSEIPAEEDEFMKYVDATFQIPVQQTWEPRPTYSSEHLYEHEETAFYFRGTVRSGQTLEYPGNIVILGDVNPGAYVIASGDIVVMGRLHGVVHAGAEGEERAVVIGAGFMPSQLRIAQFIGRPPDEYPGSRTKPVYTEKAYIKDGAIVIEPIL